MTEAFDETERRVIAGGALTLSERLAVPDVVEPSPRTTPDSAAVIDEWRDRFPTDEAFNRRLDRAGVTEAECRAAVEAGRLADDEPLPAWLDRLEAVVAAVQRRDPAAFRDGPPDDQERPFGELSAAIATYARRQLAGEPVEAVLPASAVESMAEWLRARFQKRFVRLLYVEFKTFLSAHDPGLAAAGPGDFEEPPTDRYEAFVAYLFSGGFADLCVEYPAFGRLLATQLRQWEEQLREIARWLRADREQLDERFGPEDGLGAVVALEPLADDTHGDGRAVIRVGFESGVSVAYKPRSVAAGATFYEVLDRLGEHLPVLDGDTPTYLDRGEYGWMEWLEHEPCADEAAVERYYRRVGALVCLGYLLEFVDCQFENLLANGEWPVLVDAETVLHPFVDLARRPTRPGVGALVTDSVLLTDLLPYEVEDGNREVRKRKALTSGVGVSPEAAEVEDARVPTIRAANTDAMVVEHEPTSLDRSGNVPTVGGTAHPPGEYVDAIVDGFERTYETVLALRDDGQLSAVGLPDAFEGVENRLVYRSTKRYTRLLRSLCSHECFGDGARFEVEIERLSVPLCDGQVAEPRPWALFDAERRALTRLDPPRFTCRADGRDVRFDGRRTGVSVDVAGIERSRRRIAAADRGDLRQQVELLRGCFGASPAPPSPSCSAPPGEAVDDAQFRREAAALFDRVRSAALSTDDGYHWAAVAPATGPDSDRLTLRAADGSLYAGRCGIALFGAALYRVLGEDRYRSFALDAVRPVREAVAAGHGDESLDRLGGAVGLGSVAYGLAAVGDLLEERVLVADATRVTDALSSSLVADDGTYDVVGGAAGTILGLLGAHDRGGSGDLLAWATECGDHLLENRVAVEGCRVWDTGDDRPLTGFAHGAAGIAYALARLWDATGTAAYRDAALEAIEYESRAYSASAGNWPDYRERAGERFLDQWCHGRSGVGLARLGTDAAVADERVTRGVERASEAFPVGRPGPHDHLCCGNAGRAAFLLEAERRTGRFDGAARDLLGAVLARKRETGTYELLSSTREVVDPTLFQGVSGIGYAMLRVTAPELPCVLLWE